MSSDFEDDPENTADFKRRRALARLGLGVALAYSAPIVLHLDRSANATLSTTPCGRGKRKPSYCKSRARRDGHENGHGRGKGKATGHLKGHRGK